MIDESLFAPKSYLIVVKADYKINSVMRLNTTSMLVLEGDNLKLFLKSYKKFKKKKEELNDKY